MTRRRNNKSTYGVTVDGCRYLVVLERLHNTPCGGPRFEAEIISVNDGIDKDMFFTACYRFDGNYRSEADEAKHIVERYVADMKERDRS